MTEDPTILRYETDSGKAEVTKLNFPAILDLLTLFDRVALHQNGDLCAKTGVSTPVGVFEVSYLPKGNNIAIYPIAGDSTPIFNGQPPDSFDELFEQGSERLKIWTIEKLTEALANYLPF